MIHREIYELLGLDDSLADFIEESIGGFNDEKNRIKCALEFKDGPERDYAFLCCGILRNVDHSIWIKQPSVCSMDTDAMMANASFRECIRRELECLGSEKFE